MPSPGIIAALSTPAVGTRRSWASVSESDGGTRLSFPSIDPGREVFQPNGVVGPCHGRPSLPARRLRGPCPVDRWFSRAPIPPCSSWPFLPMFHVNVMLFMTTRIAFVAHFSSLTGMRRLAFNFFRAAPTARVAVDFDSGDAILGATPLAGGADAAWTCWRPVFSSLFNSSPAAPTRVSAGGRAGLRGPRELQDALNDRAADAQPVYDDVGGLRPRQAYQAPASACVSPGPSSGTAAGDVLCLVAVVLSAWVLMIEILR